LLAAAIASPTPQHGRWPKSPGILCTIQRVGGLDSVSIPFCCTPLDTRPPRLPWISGLYHLRALHEPDDQGDSRWHQWMNSEIIIDWLTFCWCMISSSSAAKNPPRRNFFHTSGNAARQAGSRLSASCDKPPKALNPLEERLRSRFEWGLIADIQPPILETRIAILRISGGAAGSPEPRCDSVSGTPGPEVTSVN